MKTRQFSDRVSGVRREEGQHGGHGERGLLHGRDALVLRRAVAVLRLPALHARRGHPHGPGPGSLKGRRSLAVRSGFLCV